MRHKEYLRDLLVKRGLAATQGEAERSILAAQVRVNGAVLSQAGAKVFTDALIEREAAKRYVSRGGYKLEGALAQFALSVRGLRCIDVGASSGGFTDCLLQSGALQVTAVDVGYGQFDWKLRTAERVTLFERTHIAKVDPLKLGAPFDALVADLSFTSLARLSLPLAALVRAQGMALTLVKPQFELPKDLVKNGVVSRSDLHVQAVDKVLEAFEAAGLAPQAVGFSPLRGTKGNIEFWIWAVKGGVPATIITEEVVRQAHERLDERV